MGIGGLLLVAGLLCNDAAVRIESFVTGTQGVGSDMGEFGAVAASMECPYMADEDCTLTWSVANRTECIMAGYSTLWYGAGESRHTVTAFNNEKHEFIIPPQTGHILTFVTEQAPEMDGFTITVSTVLWCGLKSEE